MEIKKLTEICTPKQWKTLSMEQLQTSGFPVYGANGKIGFYSEYNHEEKTLMITCRGATCGSINISEPKSWINGNAMCLDNLRDDVYITYLEHFLKNYDFSKIITGSAQPQITRESLSNVKIKIFSIETQKQIATMLDKVSKIIAENKELLVKYDLLIKSRFIEMFGDDKYPKIHISDMVEGKVDSAKKIFDKKDEIKYIDISSVDNKINEIIGYTECVFEEAPSRAQQHIRQNDILISTVRPNLKNIAINKLPYTETVASSGFCVLRPKYVPEYLFLAVLQDKFTNDMVAVTTGANYPAIKDSDILNYEIANPPIELQNSFAAFVQQIDKSKFTVQKSLEKAETLYKSLMQEYFA